MDSQNLQLTLPSSNDSNESYTFASPRPQQFLLSYPTIKYIFTNPNSGKAWKKLIQTCKYFFSKNPVYPVKCLQHINENIWDADREIFDSTKNIDQPLCLLLFQKLKNVVFVFLEIFGQRLTFDEYQFLTSSGNLEQLVLHRCTICYPDRTLVTFDQLFDNIPQLKLFHMMYAENSSSMFKKDTFKKLADILPHLKEFSHFNLYGLTEEFDFSTIIDFILKNKNLFIELKFDEYIRLSDAYKEILESFIAKIIETPPKQIPLIEFPGFENSVIYNDYQKLYD